MNIARTLAKRALPESAFRWLGKQHRKLVFPKAMKTFMRDPTAAVARGDRLIADLIYGWGNEGFSARDAYLAACLAEMLSCRGPVLECGSGLTTVLIGAIAQQSGVRVYTLEHSEEWGKVTRRYLHKYGVESARLFVSPLTDYGDFSWYAPPLADMPDNFSLVICDGPPRSTKGGRYGLLPIMLSRLSPNCLLLFDDVAGAGELAVLDRWKAEFGVDYKILGSRKPYARVVLRRK